MPNMTRLVLPLYLYDHSGISIKVGSFIGKAQHANWDSGQVGFIYVTGKDVEKEFNTKNINVELSNKIEKILENEVKIYNDYLTGNVYGYVVEDKQGEQVDSCWGFYGDYDDEYMVNAAKDIIDYEVKARKETHVKKLKALIKNRVTLDKREVILTV